MNYFKTLGVLIILLSAVLLTSCSSSYYSASKPTKNGDVVVIGIRQMLPFFPVAPRAWSVNLNTGKKENLRVEFE